MGWERSAIPIMTKLDFQPGDFQPGDDMTDIYLSYKKAKYS